MSALINGFTHNPAAQLEAEFQEIAQREMQQLPFFQPHIPIRACGFQRFEDQWVGAMLTPWMLSLMILPGPEQSWELRTVGDRLGLILPYGNIRFTVGQLENCGQYLASSLLSPLPSDARPDDLLSLAENSVKMVLSLPVVTSVTDKGAPQNPALRALFQRRQRSCDGA